MSFQENSIDLITSHCELHPSVKIEIFEPFNHLTYSNSKGELIYELKRFHNYYYLQLRVKGSESPEGEKYRSIRIRIVCEDPSIVIDPKGYKILKSGKDQVFKLIFPDRTTISKVSVSIVDSQNLPLARKIILVQPVLYSAGFDDF